MELKFSFSFGSRMFLLYIFLGFVNLSQKTERL